MTHPTVVDLATHSWSGLLTKGPRIVALREGPDRIPPLWCLLGVEMHAELARAFPKEGAVLGIEVTDLHPRGRPSRGSLEEIAETYLREIRARQPRGPYRIVGVGFAGVVAFELATRLEALDEKLELVAVLDALLPPGMRIDAVGRVADYAGRAKAAPRRFASLCARGWRSVAETIAGTPLRESPAFEVPRRATSPEVARYAKRARRLRTPLLVIRATEERLPSWLRVDPDLGWHGLAAKVVARDLASTHADMLLPPFVESVAHTMADHLATRRHLRCIK